MTSLGIYPQIHHRTQCPAVFICRVYNKKQSGRGGVRLFQILQKERLFISSDNQVLSEIISQCDPSSPTCILKNTFPSSLFCILAKKRTFQDTQLKGELLICFENYLGFPYSHRQSTCEKDRNGHF